MESEYSKRKPWFKKGKEKAPLVPAELERSPIDGVHLLKMGMSYLTWLNELYYPMMKQFDMHVAWAKTGEHAKPPALLTPRVQTVRE